ncbi:Y43F8B.1b-like protein [Aphelenchoides besseyi]|nr:Y43F8B.1b-like protein [Aphelenchoides besseyi]
MSVKTTAMNDHGPLFVSRLRSVLIAEDFETEYGGYYKSTPVRDYDLQIGPTCGLVSIQIAARSLMLPVIPSVDELMRFALNNQFTTYGECFSAEWMKKILLKFLVQVDVMVMEFPYAKSLAKMIAKGNVVIIPYDCDKDFTPCIKDGTYAHWCVITGILIVDRSTNGLQEINSIENFPEIIDETVVHLIGYHGKSGNPGLWSYTAMKESNGQLNQVSPTLREGSRIPEGGIQSGLKNHVIRVVKNCSIAMRDYEERANGSSEEEEEDDDTPVRRTGFRMVTQTMGGGAVQSQQEQSGEQVSAPSAPASAQQDNAAADEARRQAEERIKQQQEAIRAKQAEAIEKARQEAERLQAEARARHEAARAEQLAKFQEEQQKQQELARKQAEASAQQLKTQQEAAQKQAQERAQQLKAQQEAAQKQAQERAQQLKAQQEAAQKQAQERAKQAQQEAARKQAEKSQQKPSNQSAQQQQTTVQRQTNTSVQSQQQSNLVAQKPATQPQQKTTQSVANQNATASNQRQTSAQNQQKQSNAVAQKPGTQTQQQTNTQSNQRPGQTPAQVQRHGAQNQAQAKSPQTAVTQNTTGTNQRGAQVTQTQQQQSNTSVQRPATQSQTTKSSAQSTTSQKTAPQTVNQQNVRAASQTQKPNTIPSGQSAGVKTTSQQQSKAAVSSGQKAQVGEKPVARDRSPQKSLLSRATPRMAGQAPEDNVELELQQAPRVACLGDSAWITQERVPQIVPEIQPERLQVPDFLEESPAKPTVIVPDAQQYNKIQWNEFPVEEEKERETVPRVRAQEWVPENDTEHVVQKTTYQPGRIARAWPPPGYGEEEELEIGRAANTKAQSDDAWIQKQNANETEEETGEIGNAPWRRQVSGQKLKERVWPPVEEEMVAENIVGGKISVQWPPQEFEERTEETLELMHTRFESQPHQRQWPPLKPGEEESAEPEPVPQYA